MSYTETISQTYTIADIGRVIDCFAADLDMISQSTGLLTRDRAKNVALDVKTFAQSGYLLEANIVLHNSVGTVIRAAKYEVITNGLALASQRPGNNLWPRTPDGDLNAVVRYTQAWKNLTSEKKQTFKDALKLSWTTSNTDLSFPTLSRSLDRSYASNGWGMTKSLYT
jgi:hypothetical protein